MVDGSALQVVDSFCYPCDMLSAGGGSELSSTIRVKTAWGKFRQLILTASSLTLTTRGRVYHIYVHSVLTYMPVSAGHRLNLLWPECNEMTELWLVGCVMLSQTSRLAQISFLICMRFLAWKLSHVITAYDGSVMWREALVGSTAVEMSEFQLIESLVDPRTHGDRQWKTTVQPGAWLQLTHRIVWPVEEEPSFCQGPSNSS